MMTNLATRRRKIVTGWSENTEATDRYVDIGVTLHVVRADPKGTVLIEGARPMVVLRTHYFGGIIDTRVNPPRILDGDAGISAEPQIWYCSEDQEKIVLHADEEPVGKLALGGMGAGKTTAGVIWLYLRWLENLGTRREIGITAPTETRLSLVFNEIFAMFPKAWRSFNSEKNIMTLCDGFRMRGVSTHRQSASQGSRIQAFNWIGALMDELQDSIGEFVHTMARLRSKRDGRAKRLATVTAKDDPAFRTLKQRMLDSGIWALHTLLGPNSPFIHPEHWENMKRMMTLLDFQRLVMAEDLPSESRVYGTFDRKLNVRPIPIGARKITSIVLSRKTGDQRDALLMGHDPGEAKAGTVWLDAYELPPGIAKQHGFLPNEILWWVRAELFTLHASTEQHATQAMDITRKQFGCNTRPDAERAHVRSQPLGSAEDKPDLSTQAIWKRIGFEFKFAQYSKAGQGVGQIKKDSRIGVIKTLFCNAEGKRRLFLECDDRGTCATPQLMAALETMERDHRGRAEHEEKNVKHDKSDLPAALGYALWPFEKELALALRADIRKELG
jgi:hypothetical protein